MMKKVLSALLLVTIFMGILCVQTPARAVTIQWKQYGLKDKAPSYDVRLTVGTMSFSGKLTKCFNIPEEKIKEIVEKKLKEMGKTAEEMKEAEDCVKYAQAKEHLTPEDFNRIRDNILKLAGAEVAGKVYDYFTSDNHDSAYDIATEVAKDKLEDKVIDKMADELGVADTLESLGIESLSDAVGTVSKLADCMEICREQYARDVAKWERRATASEAEALLKEFYQSVNSEIETLYGDKGNKWTILMNSSASLEFPIHGVAGNTQTWNVGMVLTRDASEDDKDDLPQGTYVGTVNITVDYDVSAFDANFVDLADPDPAYSATMTHEYQPTSISRTLSNDAFQLDVVNFPGSTQKQIGLDVSDTFKGLYDNIQVSLYHKRYWPDAEYYIDYTAGFNGYDLVYTWHSTKSGDVTFNVAGIYDDTFAAPWDKQKKTLEISVP